MTGEGESSQLPVGRTERKCIQRAKSCLGEPANRPRKMSPAVPHPDHDRLLIPVDPPRYGFVSRKNRYSAHCLQFCLVRYQEPPADSIGPGIELTYAVEWNHLMQFAYQGLE